MLTLVKQTKIAEVINNKRAYRDFLHAIEKTAFTFAKIYELQLKTVMNHKAQFIALIDIFRHHMRMKKTRKEKKTIFNSAFAANKNKKLNRCFSSFRSQQHEKPSYICDKNQFYNDCIYLNKKLCSKK